MTRKRGITVELLDQERLEQACQEHGLRPPSYGGNAILRQASTGHAVVLSYEGVASTTHGEGVMYLDTEAYQWTGRWESLPVEAVEACRTGETKDLADFIRTFGSRLDVNHYRWAEWAEHEHVH